VTTTTTQQLLTLEVVLTLSPKKTVLDVRGIANCKGPFQCRCLDQDGAMSGEEKDEAGGKLHDEDLKWRGE
jgi:hypothetical protein